jgi:hypothetical protein
MPVQDDVERQAKEQLDAALAHAKKGDTRSAIQGLLALVERFQCHWFG